MLLPLQSLLGLAVLIGLSWALSEKRSAFDWKLVVITLAVQIGLALVLLRVPVVSGALQSLNAVVTALMTATDAGTSFVFGFVGGADAPFEVTNPAGMYSLAFQALPLVMVTAALTALLWHWGILGWITRGFAFLLQRTLGIGGAVGLGTAANLFMGMIEAPLFIRNYIGKLSRSELFMIMTVGLSTISGTVLALYAVTIEGVVDAPIAHILTASLISLPAAILIARLMVPQDTITEADDADATIKYASSLDAVTQGTQDGLKLYLNIIAMLIVVIALVTLGNIILGLFGDVGGAPLTIQRLFGYLFAPLVWLIGVPWEDALEAGALMGTKAILNEFFAYLELAALPEGTLSPRSTLLMIYAMCGFANLGSVGMMISALSTMAPERRGDVVSLGMKSWLAGNFATLMTGAVVGLLTFGTPV